ncbi:MAG: copper amine oxidase N-terminal domain-containing protein [Candidatus Ozemobacteraceae bacterium]
MNKYIPLREALKDSNADITFENTTKTVTAKNENWSVSFKINDPIIYVNGTTKKTAEAAFLSSGTTMIPTEFIKEFEPFTIPKTKHRPPVIPKDEVPRAEPPNYLFE